MRPLVTNSFVRVVGMPAPAPAGRTTGRLPLRSAKARRLAIVAGLVLIAFVLQVGLSARAESAVAPNRAGDAVYADEERALMRELRTLCQPEPPRYDL